MKYTARAFSELSSWRCNECGHEFQGFRRIPVCDACVQKIFEDGEREMALKKVGKGTALTEIDKVSLNTTLNQNG